MLPEQEIIASWGEKTRNSKIRELTAGSIHSVARKLHQLAPGLHPDYLTGLGTTGVFLGSFLATRDHRKVVTGVLAFSSLMDAFDGALAREIAEESPEKVNPARGQIVDACSDRIQETAMAFSRAAQACQRGDRVGEGLAYLVALTNPLSSLARASAEVSGKVVPEAGKGVLGLLGTRIGRTVPAIAATVAPEVSGVPVQLVLDGLTAVANVVTTIDRLKISKESGGGSLPVEEQEQARLRNKALKIITGVIAGATLITYASLRREKRRGF